MHGGHAGVHDVEKEGAAVEDLTSMSAAPPLYPWQRTHRTSALNWMGLLGDDTPLSSITIPGTHDSAAYTSSLPFISTQTMDILDQLNAGVRYFDLRCAIRDDILEMVHGPSYLGLTLKTVLESMYTWLSVHPTEALIVQLKRDREDQRSTLSMPEAVFSLISKTPDRWRTENTTPLLGQLRGRIQLFRRFRDRNIHFFGMDVTQWQDNPADPFTIYHRGFQITIQDHYNFADPVALPGLIAKKGGNVSELLRRAAADPDPAHWYLNFTSAYEFNLWHRLSPREVAAGGYYRFRWEHGMNARLLESLRRMGGRKKRLGILAMDFPDLGTEHLIPAIIQTNFDLQEPWGRVQWGLLLVAAVMFALLLVGMGTGILHCHRYRYFTGQTRTDIA